jgi:hypothetical protein
MSSRTITFRADGQAFTWEDANAAGRQDRIATISGVVAAITMRLSQLKAIADASTVTGAIGTQAFQLSREERAPLHRFLARMHGSENAQRREGG